MTPHDVPWTALSRCSRWARCPSRARLPPSKFLRSWPGSHTDKPESRGELGASLSPPGRDLVIHATRLRRQGAENFAEFAAVPYVRCTTRTPTKVRFS